MGVDVVWGALLGCGEVRRDAWRGDGLAPGVWRLTTGTCGSGAVALRSQCVSERGSIAALPLYYYFMPVFV